MWSETGFEPWSNEMDCTLADQFINGNRNWTLMAQTIGCGVTEFQCQRRLLFRLQESIEIDWNSDKVCLGSFLFYLLTPVADTCADCRVKRISQFFCHME